MGGNDVQREAFDGAEKINSDPIGLWDRDNRNHRKKQRIILEDTNATDGDTVLEVGCGGGLHATEYANRFDYHGIDISESLVARTRDRIQAGTVDSGDAMDLDYADGEFDAVVGTAILHHLHDPAAALSEWTRVTRSGGSVTLMEPNWLFPKDLITTYVIEEEEHKRNMKPWRLRQMLHGTAGVESYRIEPRIYTPPWPESLEAAFDAIDGLARRVPVGRWAGQMLLIHIEC